MGWPPARGTFTRVIMRPPVKRVEQITVRQFFQHCRGPLQLELVAGEAGLDRPIRDHSLNRPALALIGFFEKFAHERVQVFGAGEMAFLATRPEAEQRQILDGILAREIPCCVVSRQLEPGAPMGEACAAAGVPLLRSALTSRDFLNSATLLLEELFAPRVTEHGTMLDIKGTGTLIRGTSGVGKSEAALALIERGHSLVADDFVLIRLIGERELRATSSPLNRGYMECRGLGIVHIARLFGVRAVRLEARIDLVVTFEEWTPEMDEDRTGLERESYDILGQQVPHIRLPVRPGRDMARLVEVASLLHALQQMGYDGAAEFNARLIAQMAGGAGPAPGVPHL